MPPQPGAPADLTDVWLRVLTSADYWKKSDGTLHNSAFSGSAIAPPTDQRPWTLEMSGRLLSFVRNLEEESITFCTPPRVFAGLMYQTVENLRSGGNSFHVNTGCPTDVIYTPIGGDGAHADLVAYGPTHANRYLIRDWLQEFIQCIRPHDCAVVEQLRN
jgi:hypothetical protein